MPLYVIQDKRKKVNKHLLEVASKQAPTLIIDCANIANPHAFFPFTPLETFNRIFVIIAEAIYRFRDTLLIADKRAKKAQVKTIVITPFDRLFNYDDPLENKNVIAHCWEIIELLSQKYVVIVGITLDQDLPKGVKAWDIPQLVNALQ